MDNNRQKDWSDKVVEELDKLEATIPTTKKGQRPTCPLCGSELVRTGRCSFCMGCGWSSCEALVIKHERKETYIHTTTS